MKFAFSSHFSKKYRWHGVAAIMALFLAPSLVYFSSYAASREKISLRPVDNSLFIAHGLGGIHGKAATNTLEAFEENYKRGFRYFEADFSLTQDGEIVAFHDQEERKIGLTKKINQVSLKEFKSKKYLKTYTLLDVEDIFYLMEKYPDAYLVTDSKGDFGVIMKKFIMRAKREHPAILSRVIPQIYSREDMRTLLSLYPFSGVIFTLYRQKNISDDEVIDIVKNSQITAVAMHWKNRYNNNIKKQLEEINVRTYVHTVNSARAVKKFLSKGVGVYTDFYPPPQ